MRQHDQDQQDAAFKQADDVFQTVANSIPNEFVSMGVRSELFSEFVARSPAPELCEHLLDTPHQVALCHFPMFGPKLMCSKCFADERVGNRKKISDYESSINCDFCGFFSSVFHEDTAMIPFGQVDGEVQFPVLMSLCLCPGCHARV